MSFRGDLDSLIGVQVSNLNDYNDALARYMKVRLQAFDIATAAPIDEVTPPDPVDPELPEPPPPPPYFSSSKTIARYVAAGTEYKLDIWIRVHVMPTGGAALSVTYPVGNGSVKISNAVFTVLDTWEIKSLTFTPTKNGIASIACGEGLADGTFDMKLAVLSSPKTKGGAYSRPFVSNKPPLGVI